MIVCGAADGNSGSSYSLPDFAEISPLETQEQQQMGPNTFWEPTA
jgi:hypothetical protein